MTEDKDKGLFSFPLRKWKKYFLKVSFIVQFIFLGQICHQNRIDFEWQTKSFTQFTTLLMLVVQSLASSSYTRKVLEMTNKFDVQ